VGKHQQYILPEICLLSRNEPRKSELKTHMRRYKAARRTTLEYYFEDKRRLTQQGN